MSNPQPNLLPRKNNIRLLQTGAFLAVLICIVMVGLLFGTSGNRTASITDTLTTPSESPDANTHSLMRPKAISENKIVSVNADRKSDTVKYYELETGKAFSVNLRTLKTDVLSDTRLPGFIRSIWIPFSEKVVSEFQDPAGISYRSYDYQTKTTTVIGSEISALAVSPDGLQLAYLQQTAGAADLYISDNTGDDPRKILTTRAQEVLLDWPTKNALTLSSRRPDRPGRDLTAIALDGTLLTLLSNRENLEYTWSPDGTQLLYSFFTPEEGVSLWYKEAGSEFDVPLGISTSARKCAWHGNTLTITCGIPTQNSLTRDVPADHSASIDDIVTVDLVTTAQQIHYRGTGGMLIGVLDPLISPSGDYFVFTNVFDQRLYEILL